MTYNECKLAYYQSNGATSNCIQDAEREYLLSQGMNPATNEDMWVELLGVAYSDRRYVFWVNNKCQPGLIVPIAGWTGKKDCAGVLHSSQFDGAAGRNITEYKPEKGRPLAPVTPATQSTWQLTGKSGVIKKAEVDMIITDVGVSSYTVIADIRAGGIVVRFDSVQDYYMFQGSGEAFVGGGKKGYSRQVDEIWHSGKAGRKTVKVVVTPRDITVSRVDAPSAPKTYVTTAFNKSTKCGLYGLSTGVACYKFEVFS